MTSKYLKLKDTHPLSKKVNQVFCLMEDLGLIFNVYENEIVINDSTQDKYSCFRLMDIEPNHYSEQIPPATEYKILVDNPEYLEEEKRRKIIQEEDRAAEEKRKEEYRAKLDRQVKENKLADKKQKLENLFHEKEKLNSEIAELEEQLK